MTALDRALATLPWWLPYVAPVVHGSFALLSTYVCVRMAGWIGSAPLLALAESAHWTERARLVWSARGAMTLTTFWLAMAWAGLSWSGDHVFASSGATVAGAVLGAFVGGQAASAPVVRWIHPRAPNRASDRFGMLLLMFPHLCIVAIGAIGVGSELDAWAATVGSLSVALAAAAMFGGALRVAQALGWVVEAPPRARAAVASAERALGVAPAKVLVLRAWRANALALVTQRTVLFTEGALEALDDAGLTAVAAHELGHLEESFGTRVVRVVGALGLALLVFIMPVAGTMGPLAALLLVLGVLSATVLARTVARRMELRADAHGQHAESDRGVYASALLAIHAQQLLPAVMPQRSPVHPHLYDRLLSAGVTPDFARPAPPSSVRPRLVALTSLGFVVVLFFGWRVGWVVAPSRDARLLVAAMAVTGGDAHDIFDLAWEREYAGDDAGALPLYELAAQTDTDRAYFAVNLSSAYAKAGRCAEAATWAHDAEQRLARTRDASDADAVPTAWDWVARCDAGTR